MKKIKLLLVFTLITGFICCQSTVLVEQELLPVLSKQEQLEHLYTTKVMPLFKSYDNVEIPTEFVVDKKDKTINAGASFGYVSVSQGLIDSEKEAIQLFVLAHEVAHIVTISQAIIFDLGTEIPAGTNVNPYQKAELLADLMAVHLMLIHEPAMKTTLEGDFPYLKALLGGGGFTHPSGETRIDFMRQYLKLATHTTPVDAFYDSFGNIWNL